MQYVLLLPLMKKAHTDEGYVLPGVCHFNSGGGGGWTTPKVNHLPPWPGSEVNHPLLDRTTSSPPRRLRSLTYHHLSPPLDRTTPPPHSGRKGHWPTTTSPHRKERSLTYQYLPPGQDHHSQPPPPQGGKVIDLAPPPCPHHHHPSTILECIRVYCIVTKYT